MFSKILIANRGEIACRVIRSARRLGVRTVAVYSDADRDAMHVLQADEAVRIGPPPANESYLLGDTIIAAALKTGAEAIHPGYGFLAENADFAAACAAAGITFIGPPIDAIRAMGSKSGAKALMQAAGVPVVPGYHGDAVDDDSLHAAAAEVGFPLLVKASAGGGGKGMRVVHEPGGLQEALASARREASSAFGDDRLLLERYVPDARHIEVQIFFDNHGNGVHLFERDCSAQRRYQKVIEEAPAPGLGEDMREAMYEAALLAGRAVGYSGAGTVEMIAGADEFFFMEMNTRLQVEHPVTEAITGVDLVEWQLRVAAGETIPLEQSAIAREGHAFEARVYAEDPARGFLPAVGTLERLEFADRGDGIRIDTGVGSGDTISIHYDPMVAKVIAHGATRKQALARLDRALGATEVAGVVTNTGFLRALLAHPAVQAGTVHTALLDREGAALASQPVESRGLMLAVCAWLSLRDARSARERSHEAMPDTPWADTSGWRPNQDYEEPLAFEDAGGERHEFVLTHTPAGSTLVFGTEHASVAWNALDDGRVRVIMDDVSRVLHAHGNSRAITLFNAAVPVQLKFIDPLDAAASGSAHGGSLSAPMPGKILATHVSAGQSIKAGDALVLMEAMKMEHTITAPDDGVVKAVHFAAGEQVDEGAELVTLASTED